MLLNKLEEPHQLVLLRQPQALILEYRGPRVRHVRQSPTRIAHEARIDALEVNVLVRPRFQDQIDGLIGAEQNPRSTQVDVEFSGMFVVEDLRDKRGNFDVGVEGARGERYGGEIVAVG